MEVLRILDEKKLEELVSNMDDRIRMHDYSKEQLLLLIEDYVTINFQGMKYQTREAILNMICCFISIHTKLTIIYCLHNTEIENF